MTRPVDEVLANGDVFDRLVTLTLETAVAKKSAGTVKRQIHESGEKALEVAQAKNAGSDFAWHFGRVNCLGHYAIHGGGRSVTISWEGGGISSHNGNITDDQWEIFKLAFSTTGRIAILSDLPLEEACYDYRFLEAVR